MLPLLLTVGLLYVVALATGRLAARFRLPRVTGYLVAGLAVGPSLAHLGGWRPVVTSDQLAALTPLYDVALGVIVLSIGGVFRFKAMRRFGARLVALSALETSITAALVFGAAYLLGASLAVAGFLAVAAITTAPAATQMVIREYESEGSLTDILMALIGMNNLGAIIAFVALYHFAVTPDAPLMAVAGTLGLPILIGVLAGFVLAVMDQRLTAVVERQIMVVAMVAMLVGACRLLEVSSLPAALAAGAILVNAAPGQKRLLEDLKGIDFPLYVIFFVIAGAELHLEVIPSIGVLGVGYIVARSAGKYVGCRLGARATGMGPALKKWLGPAMLAQAGLAIGLAQTLADGFGAQGSQVKTVVLAAVVLFEGVGPLLTRNALVSSGEVTVIGLLFQRSPVGLFEGLHEVVDHFRDALGLHRSQIFEKPSDILVGHLMRRNVEVLEHDLRFDDVLRRFGHSRYDRLPVVDDEQRLIGVIQYADVSEVLFDPTLRKLVVAEDIASPEHLTLTPDDSLERAMEELRSHPDHTYLLVVDAGEPRKIEGVVRHNDVLSAQRRLGRGKR